MFDLIFDPYNYPFWVLIAAILVGVIAGISRSFSTYVMFAYPNAKYEAIGNPFVTEKGLSRVVDSMDLPGIKDTLNASNDYDLSGDNTYDVQQSLDDNLIQTIEMMRKDNSKKMNDFFDTYIEKLDIYLIKNTIKNKLDDKKIYEKIIDEATLQTTKTLLQKIMDSEKQKISEPLKEYGFENDIIETVSEEPVDFLKLDTTIDKYVINKFRQIKVPYKCEKAKQKFVGTLVDTITIKNILRAKQLEYDAESCKKLYLGEGQQIAPWKFKEMTELDSVSHVISSLEGMSYYDALKNAIEDYNKEKSVQVLENVLDSHLLKLMEDISTQNYVTIGPTIRFIVSKEFEIENLKIIVKGVSEGLSSDFIKPLLTKEAGA
ncbi:MAG: V-type ATPase subunit [Thermoplasmatales archaeon]|nr:V-type ATPase subunit [Thermoplasmatales archaeon]MCK4995318.1 V-type ATPase subunit [Thermoplasmatales archaeon]